MNVAPASCHAGPAGREGTAEHPLTERLGDHGASSSRIRLQRRRFRHLLVPLLGVMRSTVVVTTDKDASNHSVRRRVEQLGEVAHDASGDRTVAGHVVARNDRDRARARASRACVRPATKRAGAVAQGAPVTRNAARSAWTSGRCVQPAVGAAQIAGLSHRQA